MNFQKSDAELTIQMAQGGKIAPNFFMEVSVYSFRTSIRDTLVIVIRRSVASVAFRRQQVATEQRHVFVLSPNAFVLSLVSPFGSQCIGMSPALSALDFPNFCRSAFFDLSVTPFRFINMFYCFFRAGLVHRAARRKAATEYMQGATETDIAVF